MEPNGTEHGTASRLGIRDVLANRNVLLLLALAVIGVVFQALTHDARNPFLSPRSLSTIFMQASVIGVLACGMTFVIILTHVDLSVGSALALLGAIAAWMMAPPLPPVDPEMVELGLVAPATVPSGLGMSATMVVIAVSGIGVALWGIKGALHAYTGMPAFIITLGGMMGYRGMAYLVAKREIPITDDNLISRLGTEYVDVRISGFLVIGCLVIAALRAWNAYRHDEPIGGKIMPLVAMALILLFFQLPHNGIRPETRGIAWLTLVWAGVAFVMGAIAQSTIFGRHMYATGGNYEAAELCGVHVKRINILAFIAMGVLTAIASLMYVGQQGTAESSAGNLAELDAIAACVIGGVSLQGGRGTIAGAVLGTLIMQFLTSGLYQCNVQSGYQMMIKASVLVAVVAIDHILAKR